jgi:hypothetical protein
LLLAGQVGKPLGVGQHRIERTVNDQMGCRTP